MSAHGQRQYNKIAPKYGHLYHLWPQLNWFARFYSDGGNRPNMTTYLSTSGISKENWFGWCHSLKRYFCYQSRASFVSGVVVSVWQHIFLHLLIVCCVAVSAAVDTSAAGSVTVHSSFLLHATTVGSPLCVAFSYLAADVKRSTLQSYKVAYT